MEHAYFKLMGETTLDGNCWVKVRRPKSRPGVTVNSRRFLATRVVLYIHKGLHLEDVRALACHTCDNEQCYNPDHLYIGDKSSNHEDYERSLLDK